MHVTSQAVSNKPLTYHSFEIVIYIVTFPELSCVLVFFEEGYYNFSKQEKVKTMYMTIHISLNPEVKQYDIGRPFSANV